MATSTNTPRNSEFSKADWRNVGADRPCESCGTTSNYCSYHVHIPGLYNCRSASPKAGGVPGVDRHGVEITRFYPENQGKKKQEFQKAKKAGVAQDEEDTGATCADPDQLHKSYGALLDHLELRPEHKAMLGSKADELEKLGYRSCPKGDHMNALAADVVRKTIDGGPLKWLRVPGVCQVKWQLKEKVYVDSILQEEEIWNNETQQMERRPKLEWVEHERLGLMDYQGFFLPVRDVSGRVQALRVRMEDPENPDDKYRWFRGAKGEGSKVDLCAHVAGAAYDLSGKGLPDVILVTEGEKKADISALYLGAVAIGVPGAQNWRVAQDAITALVKGGRKQIVVAYDADGRSKPSVARAMAQTVLAYFGSSKVDVSGWFWPVEAGKGLDDVCEAGKLGEVAELTGVELLKTCREWVKGSGAAPIPELDARITLIEAWESRDELGLDFTKLDAVMDSLVVMGGRGGYEDAWEELAKEAKAKTPFTKALAAAGSRAKKAEKEEQQAKAEEEAKAEGKILFERGDNAEIAAVLKEGYRGKGLVYDEGYCWTYNKEEGIWVQVPREKLSRSVQGLAGSPIRGRDRGLTINSTREPIGMLQDLVAKPQFFSSAPRGITFSNTFLAITEKGLETVPLDPRQGSRHRYDFEYDPEAKPEEFEKKLFDWFGRDYEGPELVEDKLEKDEDTKARVQYVQEFLGLSLIGMATKLAKRTLILVGDGANGKSTLQDIIRGCFPSGSTCGVKPQNWSHDQMVERLVGKRLNMVGELPSRDLQDSDVYKGVVTGDLEIEVNPKHRTPYGFYATAGHIMNTNGLFASGDNSHAFHRRNVVMEMHKQYLEAQQDNGLVDRILAKERAAIVAWMIEGAKNAIERGKICKVPQSSIESQETWKTQSDAVRRWLLAKLKGRLILDPKTAPTADYQSDRDALFLPFDRWAKANRHGQMSSSKFQERFRIAVKELARAATSHPEFWGLVDDDDQPRPPTKDEQRALDQITQYGLRRIGNLRKCPVELKDGADLSADCEDLVGDV